MGEKLLANPTELEVQFYNNNWDNIAIEYLYSASFASESWKKQAWSVGPSKGSECLILLAEPTRKIVIVISKFLERHSKARRRARAYLGALILLDEHFNQLETVVPLFKSDFSSI